jgi:hypothetical protein
MFSLTHGSYFIQMAVHVCFGFVFIGLVVAANSAHSSEASFATKLDTPRNQLAGSAADWKPSYRLDQNVAFTRLESPAAPLIGFNSTPGLLLRPETKNEADWSINIQKQIPYGNNCSPFSSLLCFDSKEEQPQIKSLRDSLWVVWRKVFPF